MSEKCGDSDLCGVDPGSNWQSNAYLMSLDSACRHSVQLYAAARPASCSVLRAESLTTHTCEQYIKSMHAAAKHADHLRLSTLQHIQSVLLTLIFVRLRSQDPRCFLRVLYVPHDQIDHRIDLARAPEALRPLL
jgi:hypothetical protein